MTAAAFIVGVLMGAAAMGALALHTLGKQAERILNLFSTATEEEDHAKNQDPS